MADPYLVDGNEWRHEPWAVELRRAVADTLRTPVPLREAIEAVLARLSSGEDREGCVEEFMDEMDVLPVEELREVLDIARTDGAYAAIDDLRDLLSRS